jgi:hypothetical protein
LKSNAGNLQLNLHLPCLPRIRALGAFLERAPRGDFLPVAGSRSGPITKYCDKLIRSYGRP